MSARLDEGARDPVIEVYKRDLDRTLLRSNLRLTPADRIRKLQDLVRLMISLRKAGRSVPR